MYTLMTSGTFYDLHEGHKYLLNIFKELGEELKAPMFININTKQYCEDKYLEDIKKLPINQQIYYKALLDPKNRIKRINSYLMNNLIQYIIHDNPLSLNKFKDSKILYIIGDDYINKEYKESTLVHSTIFISRLDDYSTSSTLKERIQQ